MNLHITINGTKQSISEYSYRVRRTADNASLSHLLDCVMISNNGAVNLTDAIELYSDNILIYSGVVTQVVNVGISFYLESTKQNSPVAPISNTIEDIVYYSSSILRTSTNFDIVPVNDLITPVGNFVAGRVTHYDIYTEVEIA